MIQLLYSVSQLEQSKYTSESWQLLVQAFNEAEQWLAKDELVQSQIDEMYIKVKKAVDALLKKQIVPKEASTKGTNIDKKEASNTNDAMVKNEDSKKKSNNKKKVDKENKEGEEVLNSNSDWIYGVTGVGIIALLGIGFMLFKKYKK